MTSRYKYDEIRDRGSLCAQRNHGNMSRSVHTAEQPPAPNLQQPIWPRDPELCEAKLDRPIEETISELREENDLLKREVQRIREEHDQLLSTLRSENGRLRKEYTSIYRERESMIQEKEQLLSEHKQEVLRLQQDLDRLRGSSHPCSKTECMKTRAEKDQLAKQFKKMEKKQCNSENCKNQELKDMNDTIGSKIRIGDREYSHSEALQFLVQRAETQQANPSEEVRSLQSHLQQQQAKPNEEVRSLQSHLQRMQQEKKHLQEQLDMHLRNAAGRCTRSEVDCQRIREKLRQGRSTTEDMKIMSGGEYDQPLEEFNEVFTNPDELLGVLESCLDPFEAKKVLCQIFQHAYKLCKAAAFQRIVDTLELLFHVSEDRSRKAALGEISRTYGLLLHVTGLKSDTTTCRDFCQEIVAGLTKDGAGEACNRAGRALQAKQKYLLKGVQVAWKFVTLPSPIIACQPEAYNPQIVDREYGYWDGSTPDAKLIYTRPVVYRCYDGNCSEKGMVANTEVLKMQEVHKKGYLQQFTDYVFRREQ